MSEAKQDTAHTEAQQVIELLDFTEDRYASLKMIPWWDQGKIAQAKIMVVGAGALGNEVLKNLALLGIGHIFIVDIDNIEASNLTRSVLFRAEDKRRSKAATAAMRVKELNPDVKVACHHGDITSDIGLGAFRWADVVICCVDNVEARVFINSACWKTGTPWINGGIDQMQGIMEIFVPPDSACYECTLSDIDYEEMNHRRPCGLPLDEIDAGRVPTTPTIASIIGALQVQETLKLVHGHPVNEGSGIFFFGTTNESLKVSYSRSPECTAHIMYSPIIEIENGTNQITFSDLLCEATKTLGHCSIELDFDLISQLSCICGKHKHIIKRRNTISRSELTCPACGEIMAQDMTTTIDMSKVNLANLRLVEAGIAQFDILKLINNNLQFYYELTGDKDNLLNF